MVKKLVLSALVAALALAAVPAPARAANFGLGVIAGEPTGVSLKVWLDGNHAVDAAVGWSFSENDSLALHADYLWHNFELLRSGDVPGRLPVYFGVGARFKMRDDDDGMMRRRRNRDDDLLGVRFPLGIAWIAPSAPVDVFVEIVPVLDLVPDSDLSLGAAIGARFWFR
jgi:hypothetical protein